MNVATIGRKLSLSFSLSRRCEGSVEMKKIYVFAVITYVVNVVSLAFKKKLKLIFFGWITA